VIGGKIADVRFDFAGRRARRRAMPPQPMGTRG